MSTLKMIMKNEAEQWFQEKHGKKFAKYVKKLRKKGSTYYDDFTYLPNELRIK